MDRVVAFAVLLALAAMVVLPENAWPKMPRSSCSCGRR